MRATSVQLYKSLVSKLHPRVVLSDKEAARLVNTLKASFRHQLDAAHPSPNTGEHARHRPVNLQETERHISSLLANPMFADSGSAWPSSVTRFAQEGPRHPMHIWQDCVSHGTATIQTAMSCLKAFSGLVRRLGGRDEAVSMYKHHRPGSQVLQWLWANDLARARVFEDSTELHSVVIHALLREGNANKVLKWICHASSKPLNGDTIQASPQSLLARAYCTHDKALSIPHIGRILGRFGRVARHLDGERRATTSALSSLAEAITRFMAGSGPDALQAVSKSDVAGFLQTFPLGRGHSKEVNIDIARIGLMWGLPKAVDVALATAEQHLRHIASEDPSNLSEIKAEVVCLLEELSRVILQTGTTTERQRQIRLLRTALASAKNNAAMKEPAEVFGFVKPVLATLEDHLSLNDRTAIT